MIRAATFVTSDADIPQRPTDRDAIPTHCRACRPTNGKNPWLDAMSCSLRGVQDFRKSDVHVQFDEISFPRRSLTAT